MKAKTKTANDNFHTSKAKKGMGDFNGMGVKQKMGRMLESYSIPKALSSKKMGKPPKSLA